MRSSGLLKFIVLAAVVGFIIYKKPWEGFKRSESATTSTVSGGAIGDDSCITRAELASSAWSSGMGRFVNPPIDAAAWDSFRSRMDETIGKAETACSCGSTACTKSKEAMTELRSLLSEFDGAARGGPVPTDAAQRQERIDSAMDAARDSLRGK